MREDLRAVDEIIYPSEGEKIHTMSLHSASLSSAAQNNYLPCMLWRWDAKKGNPSNIDEKRDSNKVVVVVDVPWTV